MAMGSRFATSPDGIPIAYHDAGAGSPALVFVHGWSCDRGHWRHQLPAFAASHRVAAMDLAGHGESGVGRSSWTMPAFGADVVAVIDDLGLDDVVLIGHSMGGDVIVEAAQTLGSRVAGLVWVDVYEGLDAPEDPEDIESFIAPFRDDFATRTRAFVRETLFDPASDPALVEWVASDMSSAPPEIALDALLHSFTNEMAATRGLDRLDVPAFAINAEGPGDLDSFRRHGMEPIIMPGSEHFLMLEEPAAFNEILAGIVARIQVARAT
jgi:pimeloyl-ACP methyl ester carboxylesterase